MLSLAFNTRATTPVIRVCGTERDGAWDRCLRESIDLAQDLVRQRHGAHLRL